ncbi:hypothetical protein ACHQM5_008867 [Ranunculus cassubicifolius]
MFEKQNFFDLHSDNDSTYGDPKSWLSGEDNNNSSSQQSHSSSNFDRVLYKNLIEVVPLVESLMKTKNSFTRHAPLIYTKTPTKEVNPKKIQEPKGKKVAHFVPAIKQMNGGDNKKNKDGSVDDFSIISSRASMEKDREGLLALQEQVDDLQDQILEKDENLKSVQSSMSQMSIIHTKIDEVKRQIAEKDSLIKSAHLQLLDVNVKLEDREAALEKIQKELTTSKRKVEELEDEMASINGEKAAFTLLFEHIMADAGNIDPPLPYLDQLPCSCIDDMNEKEMQEMEVAREAYISVVSAVKESQDDDLLAIAAEARQRLHHFVLKQ